MNSNVGGFKIASVLNGLIWSLSVSILLSIVITFFLHFTALSEELIPAFATLIFFMSILIGSIVSAKSAGSKGLIHGLSIGIIYLAISLVLGLIFINNPFNWLVFLKKIAYTFLAGAIGGVVGIGLIEQ